MSAARHRSDEEARVPVATSDARIVGILSGATLPPNTSFQRRLT